jgi:hypothetical protein
MKPANILKKAFASIFLILLLSSHLHAQTNEFAKIRIRDMTLGKTHVFIYYGNSQIKDHSLKSKDADNELIDILNSMGKNGWKIISTTTDKNKDLIFFLEREKI